MSSASASHEVDAVQLQVEERRAQRGGHHAAAQPGGRDDQAGADHRQARDGRDRDRQLENPGAAGAVGRAGRGAVGRARGEQHARVAEHAARLAADDAHRAHHDRLGAVVARRREDRRVVAVAARAQRLDRVRRDLVAGGAEADRRRARAGGDRGVRAIDLLGDARGAEADEIVGVGVRVAGQLVTGARQLREQRAPLAVLVPGPRRRRKTSRARRGARTARRSAAGSGAGSRSAPPRAARRAARGCGSSRRSRRDRPTRCRCDLHYPALPCPTGSYHASTRFGTGWRCPSRRRTSSRSRCASRRCPTTRPPRSCFRPGRRAATWCATSSGTCSG